MNEEYKEKYLRLKEKIARINNSKRLNPKLINELQNLVFVVGDQILDLDIHAVILTLIDKFNKISTDNDLSDNLEISKYYDVSKSLMSKEGLVECENCEIVLKYFDVPICITNVNVQPVDQTSLKKKVDCQLSRGLIKFYIKQKNGNSYQYTEIRTVKINMVNSLRPFVDMLYQNNDEIEKIGEAGSVAISKAQRDAISELVKNGKLDVAMEGINQTIEIINNITKETKEIVAVSQLSKMNGQRVLSKIPSNVAVNVSNIVSKNLMDTTLANEKNLTIIMVPGNQPIPLQINPVVDTVIGTIGKKETSIGFPPSNQNTISSKKVGSRASIAVDANLAIIPIGNMTNVETVKITPGSNKTTTSSQNKLVLLSAPTIKGTLVNTNNASQKVEVLENKKIIIFSNENSVVPVSQNLSIMTSINSAQAPNYTPAPQNENTGQISKNNYLESKLVDGPNISLDNSKIAVKIVRNGNANISILEQNPTGNKSSTMYAVQLPYQQKTDP